MVRHGRVNRRWGRLTLCAVIPTPRRRLPSSLLAAVLLLAASAGCGNQPPAPRVAAFEAGGKAVADGATILYDQQPLAVDFSAPMDRASVRPTVGGAAVPPETLAWTPDSRRLSFPLPGALPYTAARVDLGSPRSAAKAGLSGPSGITLKVAGRVPTNAPVSGAPATPPVAPVEIVVENSLAARPQTGLQQADVVFEYLSEYGITRFTAIYLARVPDRVGPVRSCRMINTWLTFAYDAVFMCSGAADRTLAYFFGKVDGQPVIPGAIEDYAHQFFFRSQDRVAPQNLYTSGTHADEIRAQWKGTHLLTFVEDGPHADASFGGAAPAPAVPLHSVSYAYDAGARAYVRTDRGRPSIDTSTGRAIQARTVIVMHTGWHATPWVEDEIGGARGVDYDMLGSGPAEVFTGGRTVAATWHMGQAGQRYSQNPYPVWFSDAASGAVLRLDTGLTWIHVVGDGQPPDS
jgi:hypothetical protein